MLQLYLIYRIKTNTNLNLRNDIIQNQKYIIQIKGKIRYWLKCITVMTDVLHP